MPPTFEAPHWGAYPPGHACPKDAELPMGVHHVDLRSGYHRDVVIPSLRQWAAYGFIPNPLLEIAVKVEWTDFKPSDMSPADRQAFDELQCFVVAEMCRPTLPLTYARGYDGPPPDGSPVEPCLPKEDLPILWGVATGVVIVGEAREAFAAIQEAMLSFREVAGRAGAAQNGTKPRPGPRRSARARG